MTIIRAFALATLLAYIAIADANKETIAAKEAAIADAEAAVADATKDVIAAAEAVLADAISIAGLKTLLNVNLRKLQAGLKPSK